MTNRERILSLFEGRPVDRKPFFFYFAPWDEAIDRWHAEGMTGDWREYFGFDTGIQVVDVDLGYLPRFEYQVLEVKDHTKIFRDERGILQEGLLHGATIPKYLDYPVKDWESWLELKKRLDPTDPRRVPRNLAEKYGGTDAVLQLGTYPYGLFGTLRDMMGAEELLISFYTQPDLIHEMMDYLTDFWIQIYAQVTDQIQIDAIHIWEDMSGKTGSLISPDMVREFMLPNYQKIRDFADAHGIRIFSVDTDGDCSQLIPLFMSAGVNCMFPFEVQAGCDINQFAAEYPELCIMGGINKQALWKDKAAIDAELERVSGMFRPGVRYIPAPDHLIPPEVSFENFSYFIKRLKTML